jgi:protein TIF31
MFQAQAALSAQSHVEKLNKTKLFVKIYSDFIAAATDGAKNLVDGKMAPLNPLDPKQQHIYIHNSIFYSIAQETPYDYSQ